MNQFGVTLTAVLLTAAVGAASAQSAPSEERNKSAAEKNEATPRKAVSLKKKDLSCEQKERIYRESQQCFARFRNTNASVSAEALKHCKDVKQPQ